MTYEELEIWNRAYHRGYIDGMRAAILSIEKLKKEKEKTIKDLEEESEKISID